jgi:large subunit ribosomal protein L35
MLTRFDPVVPPDYHTASQRGATEHCGGTPHSCGSGAAQFNVLPDKSGVPAETMQLCLSQCQGAALLDSNSKMALASTPVATYSSRSFAIEKLRFMRRPKGIKTKKSVAKRFKITGTGKVLRRHAGKRHLAQTKSPKRRRRLRSAVVVDATDAYRITQNLPFSH